MSDRSAAGKNLERYLGKIVYEAAASGTIQRRKIMDTQKAIEYFSSKLERTLSNRRREAYEAALEALKKQIQKKVEKKSGNPCAQVADKD